MITLKQKTEYSKEDVQFYLSKIKNNPEWFNHMTPLDFWFCEVTFGIYEFSKANYQKAKNHFNTCGLLDEYSIINYNSRLLDYGSNHITYAILSDNEDLIERYAKLRYKAHGQMPEMGVEVSAGETALTCNTVQFFMENNKEGVKRNLDIYEKHKSKILRRGKTLELDYTFFKALLARNKTKIEDVLKELVSPKIHKNRGNAKPLGDYISLPALGYAKLAWRNGIEVEIDSPLIPVELLPIKPLDKYEIPYDFLENDF